MLNLTRAGAVGAGMMAGFFFAYSNGVMPALKKLPPEQGALAMQTINRDVQNPLFMVLFMGSTLVATAIAVSTAWTWDEGAAWLRLTRRRAVRGQLADHRLPRAAQQHP